MFIKKSYTQAVLVGALTFLLSLCLLSTVLSQEGTWATKTPMPTPRMLFSANEVNDIIYVIGGTDDPNFNSLAGLQSVEAYDPATDTWTTKAPMPGPRILHASCVLNGKIYVIGGQRQNYSAYLNIMEEYDPLTDTWATKAPMPDVRSLTNAVAVGNKIYVIGGFGMEPTDMNPLASVIAYDPVTDTWENKEPMSTAKCAMGIAVYNDKIYVFGGAEGWGPRVSIVEEYDPATDKWTPKNDIPTKRWVLSSGVVDGKIYALGGATSGTVSFTPTDTVEIYNPATDSWDSVTSMPIARMGHASCVVNGKIYVFGGSSESGPNFNIISTVHEFTPPEPETGAWVTKAPMPVARCGCASCELDGKIYVMGGIPKPNYPNAVQTVDIFDPRANTWTVGEPLPEARFNASASVVNGKIYIIGGKPGDFMGGHIAVVHEFDPVTQQWNPKADILTPRGGLATCVVDNKIYAIGGGVNFNHLTIVEMYDPTTDTWTPQKELSVPRCFPAATVVKGKIYIMGGEYPVGTPASIVEEFDPSTNVWSPKTDMPTARACFAAKAMNGKIYAMGGMNKLAFGAGDSYKANEEYDPVTDTWIKRTDLPTPRGHFAIGVVDNKIDVIGGIGYLGSSDYTELATVEEYDPSLDVSTKVKDTFSSEVLQDFVLYPNYPNPFNPSTTINYSLATNSHVKLTVYNTLGQVMSVLIDGYQLAGSYSKVWDTRNLSSGLYFCQLEADGFSTVMKMLLQK